MNNLLSEYDNDNSQCLNNAPLIWPMCKLCLEDFEDSELVPLTVAGNVIHICKDCYEYQQNEK